MANATRLTVAREQAKPRKLGRYELEECLGIDAGIETYRARVRGLAGFDRIFAVKCQRPGRQGAINLNDPTIRMAKRTAALSDARIARVLDADVIDGVAVVVTEFVHGLDLDRFRDWAQSSGVLATGTDAPAQKWQKLVAYIASEAASGLTLLHGLTPPLMHGGLSPRNIIATARGGIKLLDVGLRRAARPPEDGNPPRAFAYAKVEEWAAEPVAAGDVRALGAIVFELATGEPPPAGMGSLAAREVLAALWPGMADFLAVMLSEEPEERPSAADVARAFGDFWSDVPDASMVSEMAALVRNFSAFVADGGVPAQTPSPVSVEEPAAQDASSGHAEDELVPAPTVAPPAAAAPGPDATSMSGSFAVLPDEPTRIASDAAYANAFFEALPADPSASPLATMPAGLNAPVEAMAAEIEAAELETAVPLDGLPPPPFPVEEPMTLASGEVGEILAEDAPEPSRVATSIEPVAIPEVEEWGAQALAALGTQAGVEVVQPKSAAPVETEAPARLAAPELAPEPVHDPAIEQAFSLVVRPPAVLATVDSSAVTRPVTQTLLFSSPRNLEDELLDAGAVPEQPERDPRADVWKPSPVSPIPEWVEADEASSPAELVALALERSSDAIPTNAFGSPSEPGFELNRDEPGDSPEPRPDDEPASAGPAALAPGEDKADDMEGETSGRAHGMATPDEGARNTRTRSAKKSAEDLQWASDDHALLMSSRSHRLRWAALALAALVVTGAAALGLQSMVRRSSSISSQVQRTPPRPSPSSSAPAPVAKAPSLAKAQDTVKPPSVEPVASKHPAAVQAAIARPSTPSAAKGGIDVSIRSNPPGAMVWIDGEERGTTPCALMLKPGSARIVLVRAGHRAHQATVDVSSGAKVDVTLEAIEAPMAGEARFRAECATHDKLPIVVDGRETGILCPFSKMRVEPGNHTIGVLIPATGKIHSKEITLGPGVRSISFGD